VLRWAARLHETGLDIAHSKYHRHSAYLLQHADMPGFPREEQLLLSALVGGHRRQLSFERWRICCRPGIATPSF
jgi:exopolyphosphatase/guanosine-5'-triphosphate,3'-diphosphate pyrophosphatase